jgi:hypothetical protein
MIPHFLLLIYLMLLVLVQRVALNVLNSMLKMSLRIVFRIQGLIIQILIITRLYLRNSIMKDYHPTLRSNYMMSYDILYSNLQH